MRLRKLMDERTGASPARMTRAVIFALVCVWLSWAGHDLMAERSAPLWAPLLAFPVLLAGGYLLAARPGRLLPILAAVEVAELGLHQLLVDVTPAGAATHPPMLDALGQPLCGSFHAGGADAMAGVAPGSGSGLMGMLAVLGGGHPGLGMALAHGLAGLLAAFALRSGDRIAARLADIAGGAARRLGTPGGRPHGRSDPGIGSGPHPEPARPRRPVRVVIRFVAGHLAPWSTSHPAVPHASHPHRPADAPLTSRAHLRRPGLIPPLGAAVASARPTVPQSPPAGPATR